jgi:hypothetical protein
MKFFHKEIDKEFFSKFSINVSFGWYRFENIKLLQISFFEFCGDSIFLFSIQFLKFSFSITIEK